VSRREGRATEEEVLQAALDYRSSVLRLHEAMLRTVRDPGKSNEEKLRTLGSTLERMVEEGRRGT